MDDVNVKSLWLEASAPGPSKGNPLRISVELNVGTLGTVSGMIRFIRKWAKETALSRGTNIDELIRSLDNAEADICQAILGVTAPTGVEEMHSNVVDSFLRDGSFKL